MKTNTKVFGLDKRGAAAFITVALLAAALLFTGCPHTTGGIPIDGVYTVKGVSFVMKGIAAVTNGTVGYTGYTDNDVHTVSLSAYRIGETEVTQELWEKVMGTNPSNLKYAKNPVEQVNWYQCIAFCNKLSLKLNLTPCYTVTISGKPIDFSTLEYSDIPTSNDADWNNTVLDMSKNGFRLPTEAEWEWAAKGGTDDEWAGTDDENELVNYAWYDANSDKTHQVKMKQPNGYGLYDMSGNVWERCWDWYSNSTPAGGQTDPKGADFGSDRVDRGGSWNNNIDTVTRAARDLSEPEVIGDLLGLRLVCRP